MSERLHPIQSDILLELMRKGEARFALLNAQKYPSDQFSYHLRFLVGKKLVEKSDDNVYRLSAKGANQAVLIQPSTREPLEQGFVAIRTVLVRVVDGQEQYLVQRRSKSPFRGYLSTPGGKILLGEKLLDATANVLEFETGLQAMLEPKGIVHFIDELDEGELLDKYFFVVRGDNPTGTLLQKGDTGENIWMTYEQIVADQYKHGGLDEVINIARGTHPWFGEYVYDSSSY